MSINEPKNVDTKFTSIRKQLRKFQESCFRSSLSQLATSIVPFTILWALSLILIKISIWLAIPVIILNAGFVIRLFIIFHDCGHKSFFKSQRANRVCGVVTGLLTFTPFYCWSASHVRHHATSADLDKRGFGDVWMMTVKEYLDSSFKKRLKYRLYRNPFVMFLLGPILITIVTNRKYHKGASRKEKLSVLYTNLGIVLMFLVGGYFIGYSEVLLIQLTTVFIAQVFGVWLFYVQHQFEGVYWTRSNEWDFFKASMEGGSFYDLPRVLRWFTGSIGYHHIHHLNAKIPNYRLAASHLAVEKICPVKRVTLLGSLKSLNYRLWDEDQSELVSFRGIRSRAAV